MKTETTMGKLTIERLRKFSAGDIYQDLEFVKEFYPKYPEHIHKPKMTVPHTSANVKKYADELAVWEKKDAEYKKAIQTYNAEKMEVESILEMHIKEMSGFNKIPDGAKPKVWSKAWEDGHSNGYSEVYHHLRELVDLFNY